MGKMVVLASDQSKVRVVFFDYLQQVNFVSYSAF
jgi:hypothetical protein